MKIGILSDTHNNIELTQKAVEIFREAKAELVLHAGDITSPKMLGLFEGLNVRFAQGNGDIDSEALNAESARLGFGPIEECAVLTADGKKIVLFHGNNIPLFRQSVASGEYDYVVKGHTHIFENYLSGNTRVINPGALYGAEEFSVAVLDTATGKVERIRVEAD